MNFNNWKLKFARFMVGRYGNDELNRFLSAFIIILIVLNLFARTHALFLVELLCLAVIYYRMFSRNAGRRFQENQQYLNLRFRLTEKWHGWYRTLKESRKNKIFKCPNCGQKIRIPRGHGKISIHCRKCGNDFLGKS